jgi:hypothetical protein
MSIILLRTLTKKSKLDFWNFKNTTVQNLLDQRNYYQLLSIYYKLEMITFTKDILDELCIDGEFAIKKPGNNIKILEKYGKSMHIQLREIKGLFVFENHSYNPMNNHRQRSTIIRDIKAQSKIHNQMRNLK